MQKIGGGSCLYGRGESEFGWLVLMMKINSIKTIFINLKNQLI